VAIPIRRVVTGKNTAGKAVILSDGSAANVHDRPEAGTSNTLLWMTDCAPATLSDSADAGACRVGVEPPPNGTIFRVVEFAPEKNIKSDYEMRVRLMRSLNLAPEGSTRDHPRHPGMHRTATIDYAIILSGQIDMLLDDSEVHLQAGDTVVQRGTNHAWVNRSDHPCRIAFILVSAQD
jgi:mannose-6-phosphate isomerase-like protein (cupin superfamily)